ncbi:unnamed protein product [Chironomus riparius]|uniref:Uncharacterized protein n=1 Tax=Chironomus riparius TaxID=315576 RepID=A0A9N9RUA8_9DIPT|nr:unnamed protein product [Chironomus riparius]
MRLNTQVMAKLKQFLKQNFIYICLSAACLSLLLYLIAFSCELSKILDTRRAEKEYISVILSIIYFILFLSATVLINGLATRLSMGLLIWSIIFSILTIPELWLIMMQFWGSEYNQGLTEVITYFIRLIINCAILIHILPLAIKWRREKKVLKQLESLASRLQLTSTPATCDLVNNGTLQRVSTSGKEIESDAANGCIEKYIGGIDNRSYMQSCYGSQNEFDASIFGMNPSQYIGPPINTPLAKRTQSLLDLRFVNSTTARSADTPSKLKDKSDSMSLSSYEMRLQTNLSKNARKKDLKGSRDKLQNQAAETPHRKSLGRNCVSLENVGIVLTDDIYSTHIQAYNSPMYPAYFYYNYPHHPAYFMAPPNNYFMNQNSAYFNTSTSLGNQSQDDFKKYRDVAL